MAVDVTIVVVPRDHFSHAEPALESILRDTHVPYELTYVDHSAPPDVARYLQRTCAERGFRRIPVDRPLAPNEARNVAIPTLTTPFVVFVDNDVIVSPGWLEPLLETARASGAWLVGPTYLIDGAGPLRVHLTGGAIRFREEQGRRRFEEEHFRMDEPLESIAGLRRPETTELIEFHCMLARTEVFRRVGLLDEALLTHGEHLDLCLAVRERGGTIVHEPRSRVTVEFPDALRPEEVPYYLLRWDAEWNRASIDHFAEKWGIAADDPYREHLRSFLDATRRRMLRSVRWPWGRLSELLVHRPGVGPLVEPLVARLEARATRPLRERRRVAA